MAKGEGGIAQAVLMWALALVVAAVAVMCAYGCAQVSELNDEQGVAVEEAERLGQPLDATRYRTPAFASGAYCYKVVDRSSGACWWLVRMSDGWHVLPINTGESYVRQNGVD